jgi:hypothetical protein
MRIRGGIPDHGIIGVAAWQAKITQLSQRFEGKANVRYLTIIGHSGTAARRREAARPVQGNRFVCKPKF